MRGAKREEQEQEQDGDGNRTGRGDSSTMKKATLFWKSVA
jgi:hypothetical protein